MPDKRAKGMFQNGFAFQKNNEKNTETEIDTSGAIFAGTTVKNLLSQKDTDIEPVSFRKTETLRWHINRKTIILSN